MAQYFSLMHELPSKLHEEEMDANNPIPELGLRERAVQSLLGINWVCVSAPPKTVQI